MHHMIFRAGSPAVAIAITLAGCGRCRDQPTPGPTAPVVTIADLGTETPGPPPSPSPLVSTPDLLATVVAQITAAAPTTLAANVTPGAVLAPGSSSVVSPGCEIPLTPEMWRLAPVPDAPAEALAAWTGRDQVTLTADVLEHDATGRRYVLQPVEPADPYRYELTYSGEPLPIDIGKRYRLTYSQDVPDAPASGVGLKVEDDAGPVFLGVSVREAADADSRVLKGDRAGFSVRQLATQCLYTQVTPCGVQLRAAPVEVSHGGSTVALAPGKSADLTGEPAYRITVATSHYHLPVADLPCPDRTDWVLSYRIARLPADG